MTSAYAFVSRWTVPASRERCWEVLTETVRAGSQAERRVAWWPGVALSGAEPRLAEGSSLTLRVRSPLGYRLRTRLTLVEVSVPAAIAATSEGDLRGGGRLELSETPEGCLLVWTWQVTAQPAWMRATGWLLRPAFAAAHGALMRRGRRGLVRVLGG